MFDAVLVYHTNPLACGVTKFSMQLAHRLGVICAPLGQASAFQHPLVSVKASEMGPDWLRQIPTHGDLLLHDRPSHTPTRRIWYADELGCPATISGNPTRGRYRVLTFGMAHKQILHHYDALKRQLDVEHPDYTIEMSTAIHEGTPWDSGLERSIDGMRRIFGDRLRVLGFLGDDAIAKELQECDAVAVYFDPALRANNTSAWAAVAAGKTLFTNRDDHSPTVMPTWARVVAALTDPAAIASTTPLPCRETSPQSLTVDTGPPALKAIALPSHAP